ncbi:hypothetical protein P3S54_03275 [Lactobacillus delbrueckii]|uniref:hypothetical protein n=1 Tax=Lactobacillus delbrueckii TaxID=1584 RepID=UPI0023E3E088|nr:hypothetical protein [Lactobacillus delbrueckii]MDF4029401.1 hypothetical protein [Lactobacillus delbrueckii]
MEDGKMSQLSTDDLERGPTCLGRWSRTSTISAAYLIKPEIKNVYNDNLGGWQFKYARVK